MRMQLRKKNKTDEKEAQEKEESRRRVKGRMKEGVTNGQHLCLDE